MMKTRRTLIRPPLEWQMTAAPLPHPASPVLGRTRWYTAQDATPGRTSGHSGKETFRFLPL